MSRLVFSRVDAFIALGQHIRDELVNAGAAHDRITVLSSPQGFQAKPKRGPKLFQS